MKKVFIYRQGQITRKEAKRKGLVVVKVQKQGNLMILFMVKLGFKDLTPLQKISKSNHIVTEMTGNPNFPTPIPALADVQIAIDALSVAQNAIDGSKAKTILRNLREKELDKLMKRLQAYVEVTADGNVDVILSSGFELRDPNTPVGILPVPEWLKIKSGAAEGSVMLRWKANVKSSGYRIEVTTDPTLGWPTTYESEKASIQINGLTPGVKYYFRVATLSHDGFDGYSPIMTFRPNFSNV